MVGALFSLCISLTRPASKSPIALTTLTTLTHYPIVVALREKYQAGMTTEERRGVMSWHNGRENYVMGTIMVEEHTLIARTKPQPC